MSSFQAKTELVSAQRLAFQPPFLLRNGHLQTILGQFLPIRGMAAGFPHCVSTDDGDTVVLHENRPAAWQAGHDPAVLLVHGLSGCHESGYVQRAGQRFFQRGWSVVRFDMRGCGASAQLSKGIFHAARAADLRAAIQFLDRQLDGSPLTVIGYSLGANLLLRMLGEASIHPPSNLRLGIAVAPPMDLGTCCRELRCGLSWGYDQYFVRRLWREFLQRKPMLQFAERATARKRPTSLFEFDQQVTAPVAGFENVDAYYEAASSKSRLDRITLPTKILVAADDPVVPFAIFDDARFSHACDVTVTKHGGHLGYIGSGQHHDSVMVQDGDHPADEHLSGRLHYLDRQVVDWAMQYV